MTQSDLLSSAEERSRFYWWLAGWFLKPPGEDALASLAGLVYPVEDDPSDPLGHALHKLGEAAQSLSGTDSLDELGVEFTRLFSGMQEGMGPPPPFESVWREDRLIGESTLAVIKSYAEAGFADIEPEAGPQDHICVELKYMAMLALRETEAWKSGNDEIARTRVAQQETFLRQHLATWAPRWAEAIIEQAREPLFASLAELLKAGLAQAAIELTDSSRHTG